MPILRTLFLCGITLIAPYQTHANVPVTYLYAPDPQDPYIEFTPSGSGKNFIGITRNGRSHLWSAVQKKMLLDLGFSKGNNGPGPFQFRDLKESYLMATLLKDSQSDAYESRVYRLNEGSATEIFKAQTTERGLRSNGLTSILDSSGNQVDLVHIDSATENNSHSSSTYDLFTGKKLGTDIFGDSLSPRLDRYFAACTRVAGAEIGLCLYETRTEKQVAVLDPTFRPSDFAFARFSRQGSQLVFVRGDSSAERSNLLLFNAQTGEKLYERSINAFIEFPFWISDRYVSFNAKIQDWEGSIVFDTLKKEEVDRFRGQGIIGYYEMFATFKTFFAIPRLGLSAEKSKVELYDLSQGDWQKAKLLEIPLPMTLSEWESWDVPYDHLQYQFNPESETLSIAYPKGLKVIHYPSLKTRVDDQSTESVETVRLQYSFDGKAVATERRQSGPRRSNELRLFDPSSGNLLFEKRWPYDLLTLSTDLMFSLEVSDFDEKKQWILRTYPDGKPWILSSNAGFFGGDSLQLIDRKGALQLGDPGCALRPQGCKSTLYEVQ